LFELVIIKLQLFTVTESEAENVDDNDLQSRDTANLQTAEQPELNDRHLPEETLLDSMDAMQFVPELDPSDAIRIAPGKIYNNYIIDCIT
jgi:hypothetical protein